MFGGRSGAAWVCAAWTLLFTAGCTLVAPLGELTGGGEAGVTGTAGREQADGAGAVPPRAGSDDASDPTGTDGAPSLMDAAPSVADAVDTVDSGAAPGDEVAASGDDAPAAGDDASGEPVGDASSEQPGTPPPIACVQSSHATATGTARTLQATFASAQAGGDLNVVAIGWNDSTFVVSSVTDSAGNSYALAVGPTRLSPDLSQAIYYAAGIRAAGAGENTVAIVLSSTADAVDLRIAEYSGLRTASPLDVVAAQSGSQAGDVSSGPATTNTDRALLVGAGMTTDIFTGAGASFVEREITDLGDILEDRVVSSAGAFAADAPVSTSAEYVMQLAVFR